MQTEVLSTFTILHEYGSQNGFCLSVINTVELAHQTSSYIEICFKDSKFKDQ